MSFPDIDYALSEHVGEPDPCPLCNERTGILHMMYHPAHGHNMVHRECGEGRGWHLVGRIELEVSPLVRYR